MPGSNELPLVVREALISDIPRLQIIRNSVRENVLSDPSVISYNDYKTFLTSRGKGWVAEVNGEIQGFAVADLLEQNIWALFVLPDFEDRGLGKALQKIMLDWYFEQGNDTVWLSTGQGTRAEQFYRRKGWIEAGTYGKGEVKFILNKHDWVPLQRTE